MITKEDSIKKIRELYLKVQKLPHVRSVLLVVEFDDGSLSPICPSSMIETVGLAETARVYGVCRYDFSRQNKKEEKEKEQ